MQKILSFMLIFALLFSFGCENNETEELEPILDGPVESITVSFQLIGGNVGAINVDSNFDGVPDNDEPSILVNSVAKNFSVQTNYENDFFAYLNEGMSLKICLNTNFPHSELSIYVRSGGINIGTFITNKCVSIQYEEIVNNKFSVIPHFRPQ